MSRKDGEETTLAKKDILREERLRRTNKLIEGLKDVLGFTDRRAASLTGFLDDLAESLTEISVQEDRVEVDLRVGGGSLGILLSPHMMEVAYKKAGFGRTGASNSSPLGDFVRIENEDALILMDEEGNAIGIQRKEGLVNIDSGSRDLVASKYGVSILRNSRSK